MVKENELQTDLTKRIWKKGKPYILALIMALGITGLLLGILGYNIWQAFQTLLFSSFSSKNSFFEMLKKFIPLTLATYSFAIPFKIKFFNIGGWGQMLIGGSAVAITGVALGNTSLPAIITIPFLLIVAMVAGAAFALIAGVLKALYNINPIISTIMLNFVGFYFVNFVATTAPWKAPFSGHPMTQKLAENMTLPEFLPGLHSGIVIVIVVIFIVYFVMNKTVLGYEIKAIGYNSEAANIYGIKMKSTLILTFILGGAMAGLGGGIEVMGVHHRLIEGFAKTSGAQYGIFGILTALLAQGNPLGIPVSSLFVSILLVGADAMQRTLQIPVELVFLTQALIVLLVVILRNKTDKTYTQ